MLALTLIYHFVLNHDPSCQIICLISVPMYIIDISENWELNHIKFVKDINQLEGYTVLERMDNLFKRKAKTQKGKKFLAKKEGQLEEGPKLTLFLRGNKTNETVSNFMKDIVSLRFL